MPAPSSLFSLQPSSWQPVRTWALLALLAVALSGLAPLLLIAGRASIYADMAMVKQWFTPMLVVHVNLSVGLWFLAMAMVLQLAIGGIKREWIIVHQAAAVSFLLGTLAIAFSPILLPLLSITFPQLHISVGEAFTSNYIPVQNNPVFFMGLGFVFASLLLMTAAMLMNTQASLTQYTSLTFACTLAAFVFSVVQHPKGYGGEAFYETIFWGGGHLLQLIYVQLGMFAWGILGDKLGLPQPPAKLLHCLFGLLLLNALAGIGIYWIYDVNDGRHLQFFTYQMIAMGGAIPAVLAGWYLIKLPQMRWREHKPATGCLLFSLLLFFLGGGIGLLIEGSNTTIPAHYHGSTVGITLALMGTFFVLLPSIGGKGVMEWKTALAMPILYGTGQVFHVIGLAIAGGHDIARKTAGSLEPAEQAAAAALQVMRLGGLLAVIGGGLFVVVAIRALWRSKLSH